MKKLGFFAVLLSCAMFIGCGPKADKKADDANKPAAAAPSDAAGTATSDDTGNADTQTEPQTETPSDNTQTDTPSDGAAGN